MARAIRGIGSCGPGGALAAAAPLAKRHAAASGRSTGRAEAAASELGSRQAADDSRAAPSSVAAADAVDGLRAAEARGAGAPAAQAIETRSPRPTAERDERRECSVVGGFQGSVQDARRGVLLPTDGIGRLQPVSAGVLGAALAVRAAGATCIHEAVRGVRLAVDDSDGQRLAICGAGLGGGVFACRG